MHKYFRLSYNVRSCFNFLFCWLFLLYPEPSIRASLKVQSLQHFGGFFVKRSPVGLEKNIGCKQYGKAAFKRRWCTFILSHSLLSATYLKWFWYISSIGIYIHRFDVSYTAWSLDCYLRNLAGSHSIFFPGINFTPFLTETSLGISRDFQDFQEFSYFWVSYTIPYLLYF